GTWAIGCADEQTRVPIVARNLQKDEKATCAGGFVHLRRRKSVPVEEKSEKMRSIGCSKASVREAETIAIVRAGGFAPRKILPLPCLLVAIRLARISAVSEQRRSMACW